MKTELTEVLAKQAVKKITDSLIFEINYEEDNYDAGYSASLHNHGEALYMTGFSEGQSNPKIKQLEWKDEENEVLAETLLESFYRIFNINNLYYAEYGFLVHSGDEYLQTHCIGGKHLFDTLEKAKQACQEDFEKRIKECLE